eukprot:6306845-Amphidinium_carterae.1
MSHPTTHQNKRKPPTPFEGNHVFPSTLPSQQWHKRVFSAQQRQHLREALSPKVETRRAPATRHTKLYPYDSTASQLFEPFGASTFGSLSNKLSLTELWRASAAGNRKAAGAWHCMH